MADAQEQTREQALRERSVRALERASEPPPVDYGQRYKSAGPTIVPETKAIT